MKTLLLVLILFSLNAYINSAPNLKVRSPEGLKKWWEEHPEGNFVYSKS